MRIFMRCRHATIRKGEISVNKQKITWRRAFELYFRGLREIRRACPKLIPLMILRRALEVLAPYVGIYLSARIIGELAGLRRPEEIWNFVWLSLGSAMVLSLAVNALKRWEFVYQDQHLMWENNLLADKFLSLDYDDTDRPEIRELLQRIHENRTWNGWGLSKEFEITYYLCAGIFGLLGAVTLTVTLFTTPVPDGPMTVLDHPVFIVLFAAALFVITFLAPACKSKANGILSSFAADIRDSNRVGNAFSDMGFNDKNAADIRMYEQEKIARHYVEQNKTYQPGGVISRSAKGPMGLWSGLGACIGGILTGLVYLFVCLKAWGGAFGVGEVTQYVGAVTALAGNIGMLVMGLGLIRNNVPFMETVTGFLDLPNKMYQGSLTTEKRSDRQYQVEFRDVSFRYPGCDSWALHHVSMKFQIGRRLAIVGENGSGKTTFIKLLCRLYDPQEGQILLNGIDIRKYRYDDYMDIFSVVFQDFKLLSQPLGANVAGSADYDRDRAKQALMDAGFCDRLKEMPKGLDTMLYKNFSEDGVIVSGGEAQKIAIARALYKDAPFIILDEPIAALDPIAEAEIYEKFNEISGDRTAIYISHRLSSCKFCDEIAVFEHGQVIQQGSHEQLLSDKTGKYAELWNAQAQYYVGSSLPTT